MAKKQKINYKALLASGVTFMGAGVVFLTTLNSSLTGALMMLFGGGLMAYSGIKMNEEKRKKTKK
jgi:hypothetical protein